MKKFKNGDFKKGDSSVLSMDLKRVDEDMKLWAEKREKKGNIYQAFSEYIICLENALEHEDDSYKRYLIEEEIKKLKKEQNKYYVPSILEMASYDLVQKHRNKLNEKRENALEIASRGLKESICISEWVKSLKR